MAAQTPIGGDVFLMDFQGFPLQGFNQGLTAFGPRFLIPALHPLNGPKEVDRGRSGGGKDLADARKYLGLHTPLELPYAKRDAHSRGNANRRSPTNHHIGNGARNAAVIRVGAVDFPGG